MAGKFITNGGGSLGGGGRPPSGGVTKPSTGVPGTAKSLANVTSTGGLQGSLGLLLTPFFVNNIRRFAFFAYDTTDFDCEEDCVYNFKMEDVKIGRVCDIHKVYFQYRDIGKVTMTWTVSAYLLNRTTGKESFPSKSKTVTVGGLSDNKIHSKFVDLKITGERPQLSLLRKANNGPLAIITAMFVGNMSEEEQV